MRAVNDPADTDQPNNLALIPPTCWRRWNTNCFAPGYFRQVVDALPAAVYITDIDGVITYYNEAAAWLWGWRPEIGKNQWCGSWKLWA